MDIDPDVYDRERLYSLSGGLYWCEDVIVNVVLMTSTDVLEKKIVETREGIAGKKAALYADQLLAEFVRHRILDGFREVESPMRAAYERYAEAHKKWDDARLAADEARRAWEVPAEDFRSKLKALGEWAVSIEMEWFRKFWNCEPSPFAYMGIVRTSNWLKTPGDFRKYHDAVFREIDFIRRNSEYEAIEGRLERPVGLSDFESSLKALEAAQAHAEARQDEEADAMAVIDSPRLKYREERHKAIAVLQPLSEAGRWALFRLVSLDKESSEAA